MLLTTFSLSLALLGPGHPREIVFPEYVFETPVATAYEQTLTNGIPVFIVENKELPLVRVVATFRGGGYLDSAQEVGVTPIMASLIRGGGTASISAEELDEKLAMLAARVGVRGGGTSVIAFLDCLSSNFDESFALFLDMLENPGFQESKLQLEIDNAKENMKQRNDHPSSILRREFSSKMFGNSYLGRNPVIKSIESIDRNLLLGRYAEICTPENLILSVSGDFDEGEMLQRLNKTFGSWIAGDAVSVPPDITSTYTPGIYFVDRDVPQGGVRIGLRSVRQGDPDVPAIRVMNYILGSGGFSSRITQRVRSDEGLAYSVRSTFYANPWTIGVWVASYESKSSTVALAAKLIFDEINRIKTELVSEEDLALAKSAIIERFPSKFGSKSDTLATFVQDRITNRNPLYWSLYRDRVEAVTASDVLRVANRLLSPEDMVVVIVGDWDVIKGGDMLGRATMEDIRNVVGGEFVELPLRNPLTLEALGE